VIRSIELHAYGADRGSASCTVAGPMSAGNNEGATLGERDRRHNSIDVGSRKKVAAQIPNDGQPVGQPYEWSVPHDHLEVSAEDRLDQIWCLFGVESGGW
jgi:hypothetical protein